MKKQLISAFVFSGLLLASSASAEVVYKMGYVVDRGQELIFMPLSKTVGKSRNEIEAQMKVSGQLLSRMRYATLNEVEKLAADAGVAAGDTTAAAQVEPAFKLTKALGFTMKFCDSKEVEKCEYISSGAIGNLGEVYFISVETDSEGHPVKAASGHEKSGHSETTASAFFGHFLVKNFVGQTPDK